MGSLSSPGPSLIADRYVHWWQSAAEKQWDIFKNQPFFLQGISLLLERYLDFKGMSDRAMETAWNQLRVPTLEDITRLHEKLNFLEERLVMLQERNSARDIEAVLDRLNSIQRSLEALGSRISRPGGTKEETEGGPKRRRKASDRGRAA